MGEGGHIDMQFLPGKAYSRFTTYKPWERVLQMEPQLIDEALTHARTIAGKETMLIRGDFILMNRVSPDQRTDVWPADVPNLPRRRGVLMEGPRVDRRSFLALPAAAAVLPAAAQAFADAGPARRIDFTSHTPAPGAFPDKWICGSPSAMDNRDPPLQAHWYNEHTAILRQNKAYSYEAPFAPLFFGNDRVLLLDEGFNTQRTDWDLRGTIDDTIALWCARNGRRPEEMELLVAFSHLHADHFAGVNQFADRPNTRYMGLTHEEMIGFWGMTHFPEQRVTLDLGGREILIWGSPGHVISEFTFYDRYTQILFTGDMFYRGRCYISFWQPWFDSMKRLIDFCDNNPVTHVMGCHVEISRDGQDYPYGVTWQPDEAPVQMTVDDLRHAYDIAKTITKPGIYFTGKVFLCNQTRGTTTIDRNPYIYD